MHLTIESFPANYANGSGSYHTTQQRNDRERYKWALTTTVTKKRKIIAINHGDRIKPSLAYTKPVGVQNGVTTKTKLKMVNVITIKRPYERYFPNTRKWTRVKARHHDHVFEVIENFHQESCVLRGEIELDVQTTPGYSNMKGDRFMMIPSSLCGHWYVPLPPIWGTNAHTHHLSRYPVHRERCSIVRRR